MHDRSDTGHRLVLVTDIVDRLRDRWLATPGQAPTCTTLDVLADLEALGCERAGALLERERRRP